MVKIMIQDSLCFILRITKNRYACESGTSSTLFGKEVFTVTYRRLVSDGIKLMNCGALRKDLPVKPLEVPRK